jgi:transaldolase
LELAEGDLPRRLSPDSVGKAPPLARLDEPAFRFRLNEDAMASEKLAEGIRQFVNDLRALRRMIAQRL